MSTRGMGGSVFRIVQLGGDLWQHVEELEMTRVGTNTGFCTVGIFGSKDRMDYTIIGNEMN